MTYDPRAELAQAIHRKTDSGNKIVDFLNDVLDQNVPDVRLTHRLQSARMLTKYGHFPDAERFLQRHANKRGHEKSGRERKELSEFDAALRKVILAEINPVSTAQWLIDVMQGRTPAIETGLDTFKTHHRMRAVRELLARGYDNDYTFATEADPAASETEVVRSAADTGEQTTDSPEPAADAADNPEEQENIEEILAIIRRAAEETDPSEWEEEEASSPHKPDYSMWDYIESLPQPKITEEQARIGAAQFHEAVERQRRWRESNVKVPTRKDFSHYEDG